MTKPKWKWVAKPSTIGGVYAVWSLCKDEDTYATLHLKWGKYLAYLGESMTHYTSGKTISECARKVEGIFGVQR